MKVLGTHLLVELDGCNQDRLDDIDYIEKLMIFAAQKAGATVLGSQFHKFEPQGVSGVVVLAESHLSIHTWPEYRFASCDLFTCGEQVDPYNAAIELTIGLDSKSTQTKKILRGTNQV
jgi:S-adenosylmethionine decarboxylase proenzyme